VSIPTHKREGLLLITINFIHESREIDNTFNLIPNNHGELTHCFLGVLEAANGMYLVFIAEIRGGAGSGDYAPD